MSAKAVQENNFPQGYAVWSGRREVYVKLPKGKYFPDLPRLPNGTLGLDGCFWTGLFDRAHVRSQNCFLEDWAS